jgi:hypothetical protein
VFERIDHEFVDDQANARSQMPASGDVIGIYRDSDRPRST